MIIFCAYVLLATPVGGFIVMLRAGPDVELALHGHTFRIESINCEAAVIDTNVI
jgi:hypothetical protein